MSEQGPLEWSVSIAEIFTDLGIDWALVGALAANRYRMTPRFTVDVDALAAFHPELAARLSTAGYEVEVVADPGEPAHLIRCHRGAEAIDIMLPVVAYQREALDRAVDHVLTAEDVVIHKLIAWRPRDRDDIRSILEAGVELDAEYLDHWIDQWDLIERWSSLTYG